MLRRFVKIRRFGIYALNNPRDECFIEQNGVKDFAVVADAAIFNDENIPQLIPAKNEGTYCKIKSESPHYKGQVRKSAMCLPEGFT